MAHYLKDLLRTFIAPEKNWKTELLHKWTDIIGSLNSKVYIEKIYDDTLILGVFHSCWMQELSLLSPLLIKTTTSLCFPMASLLGKLQLKLALASLRLHQ